MLRSLSVSRRLECRHHTTRRREWGDNKRAKDTTRQTHDWALDQGRRPGMTDCLAWPSRSSSTGPEGWRGDARPIFCFLRMLTCCLLNKVRLKNSAPVSGHWSSPWQAPWAEHPVYCYAPFYLILDLPDVEMFDWYFPWIVWIIPILFVDILLQVINCMIFLPYPIVFLGNASVSVRFSKVGVTNAQPDWTISPQLLILPHAQGSLVSCVQGQAVLLRNHCSSSRMALPIGTRTLWYETSLFVRGAEQGPNLPGPHRLSTGWRPGVEFLSRQLPGPVYFKDLA